MKGLLTITLLIIYITTFGQRGKATKIYYDSGKIQLESKFDKTLNCENVTEYYESGNIRSTKKYVFNNNDSQLDGDDILFYENGIIQIFYTWKNGSPSGRIYCNYSDGKLAYEKYFNNNFKSGTWKYFNQDGSLKEEEIFVENKTNWNSENDNATYRCYFQNKLMYTYELVDGIKSKIKIIDKDNYEIFLATELPLGKKLFIQNCASCHSANIDIVGPKIKGITNNRKIDWLTKMIINGDNLMQSGDKDAIELYKKWNNVPHPNFERLSKKEVSAIIDYLKLIK